MWFVVRSSLFCLLTVSISPLMLRPFPNVLCWNLDSLGQLSLACEVDVDLALDRFCKLSWIDFSRF